jgi:hypothetical protein
MKFYQGDVNNLVEDLDQEFAGMKGKRRARNLVESRIEEITGLKHTFSAYRDSYHLYHIPTNEAGGGHSVFVNFNSQGTIKNISKY